MKKLLLIIKVLLAYGLVSNTTVEPSEIDLSNELACFL